MTWLADGVIRFLVVKYTASTHFRMSSEMVRCSELLEQCQAHWPSVPFSVISSVTMTGMFSLELPGLGVL